MPGSEETVIETNGQTTPSVEELMERIAAAEERATQAESRASKAEEDSKKYKGANDKLSKENADYKRKNRQDMSETEQRIAELEEALKAEKESREQAEKENSYNKALSAYKGIEDSKVVEQLIDAVSDGDHQAIAKIINDEVQKAVKEEVNKAKAEWQKSQTPANAGTGSKGDDKSKPEKLVERTRRKNAREGNSIISNYL